MEDRIDDHLTNRVRNTFAHLPVNNYAWISVDLERHILANLF